MKKRRSEIKLHGNFRSFTPNPKALLNARRLSKARVLWKRDNIVGTYPPIIRKTIHERYFL